MAQERYAILHHKSIDGEHWDLMLEQGAVLATWRLATKPTGRSALPIEAVRIDDHRKKFLVYEGPLSDGQSMVSRFDHGSYRLLDDNPQRWVFQLNGQILYGRFCLAHLLDSQSDQWLLSTV